MTRKMKQGIMAVFCLVCCLAFGAAPAKAASVKQLCSVSDENKTVKADMTGNGKKDKIRLKLVKGPYNGWVEETQVYINGKSALSIKDSSYYYSVSLYYIHMSKNKNFLQIMSHSDNDYHTFNRIYRYDNRKKKLMLALDLCQDKLRSAGSVVKVTSKEIQVIHGLQPQETGRINWNFSYTYKNGTFKLKSSTAKVNSGLGLVNVDFGDNYNKYFKKNKYVVANALTFYTSDKLSKEAYTAQRGDVLTLKKIKISGGKVYLQFARGKKTGWQMVNRSDVYNYRSPDPGSTGWFYGVHNRLAG